jgi:hypothetical protein
MASVKKGCEVLAGIEIVFRGACLSIRAESVEEKRARYSRRVDGVEV